MRGNLLIAKGTYTLYYIRITQKLSDSSKYRESSFENREVDVIRKILGWPQQYRLPVWEIFRAFLCHHQSSAFFSGIDAGRDIFTKLIDKI